MRNNEVHAQTADPNKMPCRDCIYRDRDTMKIEGKLIRVGIMRDTCLIYDGKRGHWKPNNVYFMNEHCDFYERDEDAERFWEGKKK